MSRPDERGFASVVLLAMSSVLALVAMVVVALASVGLARHRAAGVADLAALAAADRTYEGDASACAAAARVVSRADADGVRLAFCQLLAGLGGPVEITVTVRPSGPLGVLGQATATARAGR
ncbi:MAG: Rv3654c family TadE-like protein [Mycobacteriales bacterium]